MHLITNFSIYKAVHSNFRYCLNHLRWQQNKKLLKAVCCPV